MPDFKLKESHDPKAQFKKLLNEHRPVAGYEGNIYQCQCEFRFCNANGNILAECDIYGPGARCSSSDHWPDWVDHFAEVMGNHNLAPMFNYKLGW